MIKEVLIAGPRLGITAVEIIGVRLGEGNEYELLNF